VKDVSKLAGLNENSTNCFAAKAIVGDVWQNDIGSNSA
jgi:hypothetical protein